MKEAWMSVLRETIKEAESQIRATGSVFAYGGELNVPPPPPPASLGAVDAVDPLDSESSTVPSFFAFNGRCRRKGHGYSTNATAVCVFYMGICLPV